MIPNPIETKFPHLLAADGLIDAADACIVWDCGKRGVQNVRVLFAPHARLPKLVESVEQRWNLLLSRYDCTGGNCCAEWMAHPRSNPEALFGEWCLLDHFPTVEEMRHALAALAKIRECDWVRRMLAVVNEDGTEAGTE